MPPKKPKAVPAAAPRKRPIEQYDHKRKRRANNPPVDSTLGPALLALLLCLPPALPAAAVAPAEPTAADSSSPCAIEGVERIVAVGDVHGAYDSFVAILKTAGIIDARGRWSGGRAHLVQTGDVLDRGSDSRKALDLLRRLEDEAPRAGGRVHALLGNHEVMRMLGDLRYISAGEYAAFRGPGSVAVWDRVYRAEALQARKRAEAAGERFDQKSFRKRFQKQVPLGQLEMRLEFGAEGEYGRWLRQRDAMVRIDGVVFLHGGISPAVAPLGCKGVNDTIRSELTTGMPEVRAAPSASLSSRADGPLWYRGLAQEDETAFAPQLAEVLSNLEARAVIIGHTVVPGGRIASRFGGKVFQIDTGMLRSYVPGGRASALEIRDGRFTAIYEDRRDVLLEPKERRAVAVE